ncbi:MAG: hypothetical protein NVS2B3_00970 [Vulcanimicrobiaceae bacterium]
MRPRIRRRLRAVAVIVATIASPFVPGCAPRGVVRLAPPTRIESYCGSKKSRTTSIDSVLTSTNDTVLEDRPTEREVRQAVASGDGAIAYFDALRLEIPKTAALLGESDGYARVRAAAIPPSPETAVTRHIYLRVLDHGRERWITMLAFDVQNICVEGKRQS